MEKILIITVLLLFSSLLYSQDSFRDTSISFLSYCKKTQIENQTINLNLERPRPKRRGDKNEMIMPATVGAITFSSILTLNHFSEDQNYKGSANNNVMYGCLLGAILTSYVIIISVH